MAAALRAELEENWCPPVDVPAALEPPAPSPAPPRTSVAEVALAAVAAAGAPPPTPPATIADVALEAVAASRGAPAAYERSPLVERQWNLRAVRMRRGWE